MIVEFENETDRDKFNNKAVWDKIAALPTSSDLHGIIISRDRSQKEREEYKKLKELANEKHLEFRRAGIQNKRYVPRGQKIVEVKVASM